MRNNNSQEVFLQEKKELCKRIKNEFTQRISYEPLKIKDKDERLLAIKKDIENFKESIMFYYYLSQTSVDFDDPNMLLRKEVTKEFELISKERVLYEMRKHMRIRICIM
jgi:hypothetical protein